MKIYGETTRRRRWRKLKIKDDDNSNNSKSKINKTNIIIGELCVREKNKEKNHKKDVFAATLMKNKNYYTIKNLSVIIKKEKT